jgi:hypothetical protein
MGNRQSVFIVGVILPEAAGKGKLRGTWAIRFSLKNKWEQVIFQFALQKIGMGMNLRWCCPPADSNEPNSRLRITM